MTGNIFRTTGIFRSAKVSIFSFCNEEERKLDARFLKDKNGRGLSIIRKNGIKTDEIQSITKKRNFGTLSGIHYLVHIIWFTPAHRRLRR